MYIGVFSALMSLLRLYWHISYAVNASLLHGFTSVSRW